jgi:hypothetical protein
MNLFSVVISFQILDEGSLSSERCVLWQTLKILPIAPTLLELESSTTLALEKHLSLSLSLDLFLRPRERAELMGPKGHTDATAAA